MVERRNFKVHEQLPVLPLRELVLFPHAVKSFFVGRLRSRAAVRKALSGDGRILLVAQRSSHDEDPLPKQLFTTGTVGIILQHNLLEDDLIKVAVRGQERARVIEYYNEEQDDGSALLMGRFEVLWFGDDRVPQTARRELLDLVSEYANVNKKFPSDLLNDLQKSDDLSRVTDILSNLMPAELEVKQEILATLDLTRRVEKVSELVAFQIEKFGIDRTIKKRVKRQMEKNQREYYLNEKVKAIQKELGNDSENEMDDLQKQINDKSLPEVVRERCCTELRKLRQMAPMAAEATVIRTWLDWILALPWDNWQKINIELNTIKEQLDTDHYGLEDVKDRILEHLAVHRLSASSYGPKICFVGPPGVGKTSLAKSIAQSLNLDYVRQSLGGVRDEAEIRGHRRTYIGALPGRIIQGLRKAGSSNPLFLMDEIDKMGNDFRGDPASALLEVLDPEQNHTFMDHYLDVEYDLSRIFFIATANTLSTLPSALRDRMEIIELQGYTEEEKEAIARHHLWPKQLERHGFAADAVELTDGALRSLIRSYTREAGVRNLERKLEQVLRKVAREVVEKQDKESKSKKAKKNIKGQKAKKSKNSKKDTKMAILRIGARQLARYLGPPRYNRSERPSVAEVGVAQGLAWTATGGELLDIEVNVVPGKGQLVVTGKLGEVMQESAKAALSVVRKRASRLGLDAGFHQHVDIHIHVPEGAVPKDGPSAGITIASALASELVGMPLKPDLAMTGEITLRGRVLPIGGLREKLLAAVRHGIKTVLIPQDNEVDLEKVPPTILKQLEIIPISHVDNVFSRAFAIGEFGDLYQMLRQNPPVVSFMNTEDAADRPVV